MERAISSSRTLGEIHDVNSRIFERLYPYVVPLLLAVATVRFGVGFPRSNEVLSASITMGSIFIGFLATAKSILLGLQTAGFQQIRKTKFFPLLISYLKEAIYCSLIYCCLCLAAYFFDHDFAWAVATWTYFTGATVLTFVRVVRVFMVLVSLPADLSP